MDHTNIKKQDPLPGFISSSTQIETTQPSTTNDIRPSTSGYHNERRKIASEAKLVSESLPSSDEPTIKRVKTEDPESPVKNAKEDTSSLTKIAIIKDGYPVLKITEQEKGVLQRTILEKVDQIHSGNPVPRIYNFQLLGGAIIYLCGDDQTGNWLKNEFDQNERILGGNRLVVQDASDLPKLFKVAFKTKDIWTKDHKILFKRLRILNGKFNTSCWRVVNTVVQTDSIRWILLMDGDSLNAVKEAGFRAYTGLDQGIFKIL